MLRAARSIEGSGLQGSERAAGPVSEPWLGLEFRHLAALQAIADEGSFNAAARRLGYTQSAISQQIASLERIVGVRVIERLHGRRAVGLSPAGKTLLAHAAAIHARLGAARTDIDALARGTAGPLRIGAYESVSTRLLPPVLGRFVHVFPNVEIELAEALFDLDLLRSLERGVLDLVFADLPLPTGPFDATPVLRDCWVLVARAGSAYAAAGPPATLRELARLPLVTYRTGRAMESVLGQLRANGEVNIVLRSNYNESVQGHAAAGLGVALMPHLAVNLANERTVVIELGELLPPREITVARHRERSSSEAADALVALAVELGRRLEAERDCRSGARLASA